VGMVALVVVFQQEIRRFLLMVGSTNFSARRKFIKQFRLSESNILTNIDAIIHACENMGKSKTGALIVFKRQ